MASDTIHALASGAPPCGVAVVRVSGPAVVAIAAELVAEPPPARQAALRRLRDADGSTLDHALVLRFPSPNSFTGEDVLELHLHGGRAVVAAVQRRLSALGSRPAEPGEFTMRAQRNGRIDLVEAERLADLVQAETEAQRRFATSDLGRRNAARYEDWRERLLGLRALVEASLDFADEDDAPVAIAEEVASGLGTLRDALADHLAGEALVATLREGFRVVLAGPPNAGKSSLLNALAREDVAIVTPVPGTTRDVLEVPLDLGGFRVVLADTAGLRDTDDVVEAIGVARARARMAEADLVLRLVPPGESPPTGTDDRTVLVASKIDLGGRVPDGALGVSATTGAGLDRLLVALGERAAAGSWREGRGDAPVAERHAAHLKRALAALDDARAVRDERCAEHLRLAADEIGRIGGAVDIEDVYGAIFSRFCMGK